MNKKLSCTRRIGHLSIASLFLFSPGLAWSQSTRVYFGNLHSHTSYSDGSGLPAEAYKHAKAQGLDFMAITEHNHSQAEANAPQDRRDGILIAKKHSLYTGPAAASLIPAAKTATTPDFVALYGQEFSSISKGNHVNVFDVPDVVDEAEVPNGDFKALVEDWLPNHKDSTGSIAILQLNHPEDCDGTCVPREYGQDDFGSKAAWIKALDPVAHLIEIENGPGTKNETGLRGRRMEGGYLHYLSLGFHLAPSADQDNHYKTWGDLSDARTAVIALGPKLTKQNLLAALRARHVYATEDKNLQLIFRVNGHLCGDRIAPPASGSELQIDYTIADPDEPAAAYEIQPYFGKLGHEAEMDNAVEAADTGAGPPGKLTGVVYDSSFDYVFFRVVQQREDEDEDLAWTAPVWFDGTAVSTPTAPEEDASGFVASKNSTIYHVSKTCKWAKKILPANRINGSAARVDRRPHEGCPQ